MVDFYVYKIRRGECELEKVPSLWRDKVREKLNELAAE